MNSAIRARSIRVLTAGVMAVALLGVAPSTAQAGSPYVNPCLSYSWLASTELDIDKNRLGECTPGTSGLFPIWNNNIIVPLVTLMNMYLSQKALGGKYRDFTNNVMGRQGSVNPADAAGFAQAVAAINGDGMPAGYTPTETTGEWIQKHLQPLRDHRVTSWFNTTWSSPRDTHRQTRYDSDIWTLSAGADLPLMDDSVILGAFGSYTKSDVDTTFNNGGVDSDLGTIGSYVAYTINQFLAVDTTVAGVFGSHQNRIGSPSAGMGSAPRANGDQDTSGWFLSMNANANYWIGNWGVQGRVGFLHSDMETDGYTLRSGGMAVRVPGSNNELTQVSVASQVNYFCDKGLPYFENVMVMPYGRITWNYDLDHDNIQLPFGTSQHPNDDDEIVVSWGATFFGNGPFSGSIEAGRTLGRSRFESWTVSSTVNYAF